MPHSLPPIKPGSGLDTSTVTTVAIAPPMNGSGGGIGNGVVEIPTADVGISNSKETNNKSAVGLANPKMSQASRRMLDLVNGLHSTGYNIFRGWLLIG